MLSVLVASHWRSWCRTVRTSSHRTLQSRKCPELQETKHLKKKRIIFDSISLWGSRKVVHKDSSLRNDGSHLPGRAKQRQTMILNHITLKSTIWTSFLISIIRVQKACSSSWGDNPKIRAALMQTARFEMTEPSPSSAKSMLPRCKIPAIILRRFSMSPCENPSLNKAFRVSSKSEPSLTPSILMHPDCLKYSNCSGRSTSNSDQRSVDKHDSPPRQS